MNIAKTKFISSFEYIKVFLKWLIVASIVGAAGGVIGSLFHIGIEYVTELRHQNGWLIFLLPFGGLVITALYSIFPKKGKIDTNRVLESVRTDEKVPLIMAPLIFAGTVLTHLFGGSAGREGAALQLGGSLGYNIGKVLRMNKKDLHIIVMSGMSAVFAALFGTPLTAAFFAIEVVSIGVMHYGAIVPCVISSIVAQQISQLVFDIEPMKIAVGSIGLSFDAAARIIVLAILCALVSILLCMAIRLCNKYSKKLIPNKYLRVLAGSALIILLTVCVGNQRYNGAGMELVFGAVESGTALALDFLLKLLFTAITIAAGFKGGEIVPSFVVGSTFGCVLGGVLGIDPGFAAAIGLVAVFCGVVNCPVASLLLSVELFGADSVLIFALVCGISFMMSGNFGLYSSQKILYSKLDEEYIDIFTK